MLFVFLSLIFILAALAGAGRLGGIVMGFALRGSCAAKQVSPWVWPWVGFLGVGTIAALISFFRPVDIWSLIAFLCAGLCGVPFWCRDYKKFLEDKESKERLFWAVSFLFLCAVAVAFSTSIALEPGDTGLYHAGAVRWLNEYGTVKGLANIHNRFGFNSLWLLFSAVIDNGPWNGRSAWIMPGIALLGTFFYFLHALLYKKNTWAFIYCAFTLPWLILALFTTTTSLEYDRPALFLNSILVLEAFNLLAAKGENIQRQTTLVLCLAAAAFLIKPLAAVSLVCAFVLSTYMLYRHSSRFMTSLFASAWPAAVGGIIWVVRNMLLTGYPLFPATPFGLPFAWAIPWDLCHNAADDVISWARMPGPGHIKSLQGYSIWLGPWIRRYLARPDFWLNCIFPLLCGLCFWGRAAAKKAPRQALFFFIWSLGSLVYWFLAAPNIRFVTGFFHVFLALAAAYALRPAFERLSRKGMAAAQNVIVILLIVTSVFVMFYGTSLSHGNSKRFWRIGKLSTPPLSSKVLDDSVSPPIQIYFPVKGDHCSDAPLPCIPFASALMSRYWLCVPGDLGSGFCAE